MRKLLLFLFCILLLPIAFADSWNLDNSIYYQSFNNNTLSGATYTDIALNTVDNLLGTYNVIEDGVLNQSLNLSGNAYATYGLGSTGNIWQTTPTNNLDTVSDGAISIWIKPDSNVAPIVRSLFSVTPASTSNAGMGSQLILKKNNTLHFRSAGISGDSSQCRNGEMNIYGSIIIANDTWTHIVMNFNRSFVNGVGGYTYTVNGINDTDVSRTITSPNINSFLDDDCGGAFKSTSVLRTFGGTQIHTPGFSQLFSGEIDELGIWPAPLTVPTENCTATPCSQTCALYNNGTGYNPYSGDIILESCNPEIIINVEEVLSHDSISDFNYTVYNTGGTVIQAANGTSDSFAITGVSSGTFTIVIEHEDYMFFNETSMYVNTSQGTVQIYKSLMNISAVNVKTGDSINEFSVIVTDGVYNDLYTTNTGNITAKTLTGDYTLNGYTIEEEVSLAVSSMLLGETRNITLQMGFNLTLLFINEHTLLPFNTSSPDTIEIWVDCPSGRAQTFVVNKTNPIVPVTCAYTSFNVRVYNGPTSYIRRYIAKTNFNFSEDVYLIDLDENLTIVYMDFLVDDTLQQYTNKTLYIKKKTVSGDVVITSSFLDAENKMPAFLLQNNEYFIELHSTNNPILQLGNFIPYQSGTRNIRLFPYGMGTSAPSYYTASWHLGRINSTAFIIYNDTGLQTNSIAWSLYNNSFEESALISRVIILNSSFTLGQYINTSDISAYTGNVFSKLTVNFIDREFNYTISLDQDTDIDLNITNVFGQELIDWALIILLSLIFLYGTITTTHIVSLFASLVGFTFSLFSWLSVPIGIFAICILFSFLALVLGKGGTQI